MKSKFFGLVVFVLLGMSQASATTVYNYLGDNFTFVSNRWAGQPPYNTSMRVTGTVILANPLPANLPLVVDSGELPPDPFINVSNLLTDPNLLDFSFNDGLHTIGKSSLTFHVDNMIAFGTDAAGSVVSWLVKLVLIDDPEIVIIADTTGFYGPLGSYVSAVGWVPPISTNFAAAEGAGNWSATPLPAALPLFATGLGALGLIAWKRKHRKITKVDQP